MFDTLVPISYSGFIDVNIFLNVSNVNSQSNLVRVLFLLKTNAPVGVAAPLARRRSC